MSEWIVTTDAKWIKKWDLLQKNNEKGKFTQLSIWLNSYISYGFSYELLLKYDSDNILFGSANVIVKILFFKLYICSYGPFSSDIVEMSEKETNEYLYEFKKRAKNLNSFIAQIGMSDIITDVLTTDFIENKYKFSKGVVFPKIASIAAENIIDILSHTNEGILDLESIINTFLPYGRRDVRASLRKNLILRLAEDSNEIEEAYRCFQNNADNKGYKVREWNHIKSSLLEAIEKKYAYILTAFYEDHMQGAILVYIGGNTMNYTMGGVKRHKPDLLTGYFLQIEAMRLCASLNIKYYNITSGGPKEVQDFKHRFNPILKEYPGIYYIINNKILYYSFILLYNVFKRHISTIIKIFERKQKN